MSKHITASPLTWPEGWQRSSTSVASRFGNWDKKISIAKATDKLLHELELMGIPDWNVIISSDLRLRNDGLPYSNQRSPEDKGIAVWWKDDSLPSWRNVLDYFGDDLDDANVAFKVMRSKHHPDKGGDINKFHIVNQAWHQAEIELKGGA